MAHLFHGDAQALAEVFDMIDQLALTDAELARSLMSDAMHEFDLLAQNAQAEAAAQPEAVVARHEAVAAQVRADAELAQSLEADAVLARPLVSESPQAAIRHHALPDIDKEELGRRTLYHMTTETNATSIVQHGFNCSRSGMFGPFIYFAASERDCDGKAHFQGAVLWASVDLGTALVCKTSRTDLTASGLARLGCQSVKGTAPAVSRDEYAVPSSHQISNIRLISYKTKHGVDQPWWTWPAWVHALGRSTGVQDDLIEMTSSSLRINMAGRPIHANGRFMSYAEACSNGWVPESQDPSTHVSAEPTSYKGGQFIPGGGRAPAGGCMITTPTRTTSNQVSRSPSSGEVFYKGGQFTPGGGRAPAGGCYSSPLSGLSSSGTSAGSRCSFGSSGSGDVGGHAGGGGGENFFKGGQFMPGGGRAPKGGAWT